MVVVEIGADDVLVVVSLVDCVVADVGLVVVEVLVVVILVSGVVTAVGLVVVGRPITKKSVPSSSTINYEPSHYPRPSHQSTYTV